MLDQALNQLIHRLWKCALVRLFETFQTNAHSTRYVNVWKSAPAVRAIALIKHKLPRQKSVAFSVKR